MVIKDITDHKVLYIVKIAKKKTDALDKLDKNVGVLTDAEIARLFSLDRPGIDQSAIPKDVIKHLGVITDAEIGRKFNIREAHISRLRNTLGIAPADRFIVEVPKKILRQLGKISDGDLARKAGLSVDVIKSRRLKLGIPAPPRKTTSFKTIQLPSKVKRLLGRQTDEEIAEKYGYNILTLKKKRKELGIDSPYGRFGGRPSKALPPEAIKLLGATTDTDIAARFDISENVIRCRRRELGIPRFLYKMPLEAEALLGVESDSAISRRFKIPIFIIHSRRKELNLPKGRTSSIKKELPSQVVKLLGKEKDSSLAIKFKIPCYKIAEYRRELKIPLFIKPRK